LIEKRSNEEMKEIRSMSAFRRTIDSWPWPSEKRKEEYKDTMLPSIKTHY